MSMYPTKGFTLVETLVAITILTMAITGPLFIAQQSFNSAVTARDRTTASFLAQEGVEYIRSVRDHNYLSNKGNWLARLGPCIGKSCTVDSTVSSYPQISSCGSACPLLKQTSTGLFGYAGGSETRFRRTISMEKIQDHEVSITVEVSWEYKKTTRTVTVQETLFNWL